MRASVLATERAFSSQRARRAGCVAGCRREIRELRCRLLRKLRCRLLRKRLAGRLRCQLPAAYLGSQPGSRPPARAGC